MMENREASRDQNMRSDTAHEKQLVMNNLLRAELLGQSVAEYSLDARMDGQVRSPGARREGSGSNLFKYRASSGGSGARGSTGGTSSGGSSGAESRVLSSSVGGAEFGSSSSSGAAFAATGSPARRSLLSPKKPVRKISKTPYKILDAPALQDDYYLNLVDWSHANVLAVALGSCVYLWSAATAKVSG